MAVEREKRRLEEVELQAKKDMASKAVFLEGRWRGDGLMLKTGGGHLPITQQIDFIILQSEPYAIVEIQQYTRDQNTQLPLHVENGSIKIIPGEYGKPPTVEGSFSELGTIHDFEVGTIDLNTLSIKLVAINEVTRNDPGK